MKTDSGRPSTGVDEALVHGHLSAWAVHLGQGTQRKYEGGAAMLESLSTEQLEFIKAIENYKNEKKKLYNEHVIQVEKGSFTPLIFTTSGGMGPECTRFNRRIAELISIKTKEQYSAVMNHVRVRLRFALLRSVLISIRGIRGNVDFNTENMNNISFNLIPHLNSYEAA